MTNTFELVLRLTLGLTLVLGLMWFAARVLRNVGAGRATGVMEVLARQQIGRGSQVAIIRVGDSALVVGVTESKVSLLTETDLEVIEAAQAKADAERVARQGQVRTPALSGSTVPSPRGESALHGSILAPSTWRQALHAVRERTVRSK